ncbi:SusC/RagA family TonB-linked outer membrane protein [Fibrella aquatica]|uniref:SusC/RagA family TonB-linked outer membrane protein n=1 Tax=Fibrella aquatica TaxID=3242487 RepID=UPI0035230CB4
MNRKNLYQIVVPLLVCLLMLAMPSPSALAQQRTLTGKITGEKGDPLPGATVVLKGTSTGTSTNADGNFTLPLAADQGNAIVVVSYIGYLSKEIPVGNQSSINVTIEPDSKGLQEVIVVGYGTQKKESITGAISAVTAKDVGRVHAATVTATLAGKIPGVQFRQADGRPGAAANIQIRNMGGNPLFIIDGVPKDKSQFDNISPNDVETITVLKDASASIYGSRAANGVIIVTTKRGALGQKSTINLDAYYGFQNWTRFPSVVNAYEWNLGKAEAEVNRNGTTSITQSELDKYRAGTEYGYQSFDWYDFIIQPNAPQSNINLSASGGSDKINYYISATRLDQNSVMGREFIFNRSNIQSNIDAQITDRIKVGLTIAGRQETRENPGVPGGDDYVAPKFAILRNRPGERPYANDNPAYINTISNPASNWGYLNYQRSGFLKEVYTSVTPQFTGEYRTPLKGLVLKGLYSYMFRDSQREVFEYTYDTYTYNPTTQAYNRTGGSQNPYRQRVVNKIDENIGQIQLNYTNTFGKHTITALALTERLQRRERNVEARTVPKTNTLPVMQFADIVAYNDADFTQARVGYVGRVNYGFADKYFVEVAARRDASWKFSPTKRWGTFPSVSAAWRISEEPFFKSFTNEGRVLTDLKLRASYGQLGDDNVRPNNADLDPFAYNPGYSYNTGVGIMSGVTTVAARDRGIANDRVSWLTAKVTDIGLDFSLLNNKITGTLDYFRRNRDGLPAVKSDVFVPSELGYALPQENLERDAVVGGEGSLVYNGSVKGLRFTVGGNISYARSRYITPYNPRYGNSLLQYRESIEDRWSGIFWGYEAIGQFQSQEEINNYPVNIDGQGNRTMIPGDLIYRDANNDGIINSRDERPIGYSINTTPILSGGFNFTMQYKGWDFAADFSAGSMMAINRQFEQRNAYQNTGNVPRLLFDNRWRRADPLNPDSEWIAGTEIPLRYNDTGHSNINKNSTWWLLNIKYIRNRTMELGYTLPTTLTQKVKIQRARAFVNTYNLFSIDNTRPYGIDPEVQDENGLQYPQTKLVNFGLNLSF